MENARKYKVGLVQMRMGPDPDANLETAIAHIREAAKRGAHIVCLPELFRAQYFCQREDIKLFDLAEPMAQDIMDRAMERGLLVTNAGPSTIRFVPPLILQRSDIDEAMEKLDASLAAL